MTNPILHEEEVISRKDLVDLLEYSTSIPTGVIIGKRWRCASKPRRQQHEITEWFIRTYVQDPHNENMALIVSKWAVDENHKPYRGDLR